MTSSRLQTLLDMYAQNPADSFVTYALAKEYESADNPVKAEEYFRKILQNNPDYVGMYYHFGKLLWNLHRDDEATHIIDLGITVAEKLGDKHALGELRQLRWEVSDEDI